MRGPDQSCRKGPCLWCAHSWGLSHVFPPGGCWEKHDLFTITHIIKTLIISQSYAIFPEKIKSGILPQKSSSRHSGHPVYRPRCDRVLTGRCGNAASGQSTGGCRTPGFPFRCSPRGHTLPGIDHCFIVAKHTFIISPFWTFGLNILYRSVALSTLTTSCKHHHHPLPGLVRFPKLKLRPH